MMKVLVLLSVLTLFLGYGAGKSYLIETVDKPSHSPREHAISQARRSSDVARRRSIQWARRSNDGTRRRSIKAARRSNDDTRRRSIQTARRSNDDTRRRSIQRSIKAARRSLGDPLVAVICDPTHTTPTTTTTAGTCIIPELPTGHPTPAPTDYPT